MPDFPSKLQPCAEVLAACGLGSIPAQRAVWRTISEGDYLCRAGDALDCILILVSGRAKVCYHASNGRTLLFCFTEQPYSLFGEVELMTHTDTAISSVQAVTVVQCVSVPLALCRQAVRQDIALSNYIAASLAQKLARWNRDSVVTILNPLEMRLCGYILSTQRSGYFYGKLTELSELFGVSYRHLLRTLAQLCAQGVLEKVHGGYRIADAAALEQKANGSAE